MIEYRDFVEVPALIEAAQRAARIAPHAGVLVVPRTAESIEEWTANVAAGAYRDQNNQTD